MVGKEENAINHHFLLFQPFQGSCCSVVRSLSLGKTPQGPRLDMNNVSCRMT